MTKYYRHHVACRKPNEMKNKYSKLFNLELSLCTSRLSFFDFVDTFVEHYVFMYSFSPQTEVIYKCQLNDPTQYTSCKIQWKKNKSRPRIAEWII